MVQKIWRLLRTCCSRKKRIRCISLFSEIYFVQMLRAPTWTIYFYIWIIIDLYLLCTYKNTYISTTIQHIYIYIYSMHGATLMQKCRALIFFLQPVRPSERCKKAVVLDRSHRGRSRMRVQDDLPRHVHVHGCIYIYTHDTIYTKSIVPMSTYTKYASLYLHGY